MQANAYNPLSVRPTEVQIVEVFTSCGSLIPFTGANAQWVIHGFN